MTSWDRVRAQRFGILLFSTWKVEYALLTRKNTERRLLFCDNIYINIRFFLTESWN